jgi:phosphatidylinositol 4-kinase
MKPALDRMTNIVVNSLSGEARTFYDREFNFFHGITSISGKLKPFIKRPKAEKKVSSVFRRKISAIDYYTL